MERIGSHALDVNEPKDAAIANAPLRIPPFATASHAYLIVAGILLGVLAGPAVLGRLAPAAHRAMFDGPDVAAIEAERDASETRFFEDVEGLDVTKQYVEDQIAQIRAVADAKIEDGRRRQIERVAVLSAALLLGLVVTMLLESVLAPEPDRQGRAVVPPTLGRLITVRYALAGLMVAVLLASPVVLWAMPLVFAGLVIVVALGAGLVPLGGGKAEPDPSHADDTNA